MSHSQRETRRSQKRDVVKQMVNSHTQQLQEIHVSTALAYEHPSIFSFLGTAPCSGCNTSQVLHKYTSSACI